MYGCGYEPEKPPSCATLSQGWRYCQFRHWGSVKLNSYRMQLVSRWLHIELWYAAAFCILQLQKYFFLQQNLCCVHIPHFLQKMCRAWYMEETLPQSWIFSVLWMEWFMRNSCRIFSTDSRMALGCLPPLLCSRKQTKLLLEIIILETMAVRAKLLAFYWLLQKCRRQRTTLVSEIHLLWPMKGEYHMLMPDLRAEDRSFFSYFRMDQAHLDDLLKRVTPLNFQLVHQVTLASLLIRIGWVPSPNQLSRSVWRALSQQTLWPPMGHVMILFELWNTLNDTLSAKFAHNGIIRLWWDSRPPQSRGQWTGAGAALVFHYLCRSEHLKGRVVLHTGFLYHNCGLM